MPWVHKINKTFMEMTGRPVRANFCAPFSLAANIRGYENLINDIYENPAFAHRLFDFLCDEVLVPYIEAMRSETGNPALFADGADAWASPPMITLDMMDEYVVAYAERLRRKSGDRLALMGHWGDAKSRDVERFIAQKLACSPGFLRVLDPDLYEIGPERVKAFANEHDASVTAGVDATLLREGPAEAIVRRIRHYIDTMARDGRAIVFLNQIPAETPPEHIHAAVAACHTYGRFPIAENLDDVEFEVPERESFSEFLRDKGERVEE
jgi:uroporphyrinogen decarboxylase